MCLGYKSVFGIDLKLDKANLFHCPDGVAFYMLGGSLMGVFSLSQPNAL